jgi:Fic family protein
MLKIEGFKSGILIKNVDYKAFMPNKINQLYIWEDGELSNLTEQAALTLGKLDAYADLIPNVSHFIKMYVTHEATVSSKIEGNQTHIEEVFLSGKI